MAKQVNHKRYFNFISGLNTESGFLTYPENTWSAGTNIVPFINGALKKRTAVDLEPSYVLSPAFTQTAKENGAFVVGEWTAVGGIGAKNFAVVQMNSTVYFYAIYGETISTSIHATSINLNTYKVAGNPNVSGVAPISCASGNGYLILTSSDTYPILVEYTAATDTISVTTLTLNIRDFHVYTDGLLIDERPATLSSAHQYNLLNQGWTATQWSAYFAANTVYPSNAQIWTAGKDTSDVFQPALLDKQDFGNSPAPLGKFVLDVLDRDYSTVSGVGGLTTELESYGPTAVAFFAGRAWYAGIQSATISNWVMFSQVVDVKKKFGYCYQEADPTSEVISDLIASDGGVIPIQDAGTIVKLVPLNNAMLVFADNGIWQISGGQDGFSASVYQVKKVSSIGVISAESIVDVESTVFFISTSGIYVLSPDPVSGSFVAQSITDTTVKTLVSAIPASSKPYIKGLYQEEEKKLYFAYNSNAGSTAVDRYKKNMFLVFDLRLKSFYTLTISGTATQPFICNMVLTKGRSNVDNSYTVVVGADTIVVGTDTVVAGLAYEGSKNKTIKMLTCVPQSATSFKYTFSDFDVSTTRTAPTKFKDWYSFDSTGSTYDCYFDVGYEAGLDNFDKMKQPLYVTTFMEKTETGFDGSFNPVNESSCLMKAKWDWTSNATPNHWSTQREVYRHVRLYTPTSGGVPSDGYPLLTTKNKIRGEGKAFSLHFEADPLKDLRLVGWEISFIGNSNV